MKVPAAQNMSRIHSPPLAGLTVGRVPRTCRGRGFQAELSKHRRRKSKHRARFRIDLSIGEGNGSYIIRVHRSGADSHAVDLILDSPSARQAPLECNPRHESASNNSVGPREHHAASRGLARENARTRLQRTVVRQAADRRLVFLLHHLLDLGGAVVVGAHEPQRVDW